MTDGETNASLRKGDAPESITLQRAVELLAERRAAAPAPKRRAAARQEARVSGQARRRRRRREDRRPLAGGRQDRRTPASEAPRSRSGTSARQETRQPRTRSLNYRVPSASGGAGRQSR